MNIAEVGYISAYAYSYIYTNEKVDVIIN